MRTQTIGETATCADDVRPLGSRVLLLRDANPDTVGGGLVIVPRNAKVATDTGVVLAVGAGWRSPDGHVTPVGCAVGDRVVFDRFRDSDDIELGGKLVTVLDGRDILAVIEGSPS